MMRKFRFTNRHIVFAILLLIFVIRLPHLSSSPYEYDSWRQSDTEAIAVNFVEHTFNILYPQLNYEGPMPNYVQLELQITTFLIAVLYKAFGYHYALARIVPVLFFKGSALFLYMIGKHYYSPKIAVSALFIYGILPLNILYSRAIMPESAALFFYLGAFYFYMIWIKEERLGLLLLSGLFMAAAIAEKIPTVFLGIPMLFMAISKYKLRFLLRRELWMFAVLSLAPPYIYFRWLQTIAEYTFVSGIAVKHVLPHMFTAVFSENALRFFYRELPSAFTWPALALFAAGLARLNWRQHGPLGIWAWAMIVEAVTIVAVIQFNYYLIFIGPVIALLVGSVLAGITGTGLGRVGASALILAICFASFRNISPILDRQYTDVVTQGKLVQRITKEDDLIVVGTDDPSLLNATRRKGWRISNTIPDRPVAELQYFIRHGAKYFVPLKGHIDKDDGTLKTYLDSHFAKINLEGGYSIYKLSQK